MFHLKIGQEELEYYSKEYRVKNLDFNTKNL